MRTAARVDANQAAVVAGLRRVGATVALTHMIGDGFPDCIAGYRGVNYLLEIKDENKPPSKRRLTPDEVIWHQNWAGQVTTVKNLDEALLVIGATNKVAAGK